MPALEGRDLIARAKTGTGKTLAFGIPIIKKLTSDEAGGSFSRFLDADFFRRSCCFIMSRSGFFLSYCC